MAGVVFLFTDISDAGGIETFSRDFLRVALDKRPDLPVAVVLLKNDRVPAGFEDDAARVQFYCCGARWKMVRRLGFVGVFARLLLSGRYGAVFANHLMFAPLCAVAHVLLRTRYVVVGYGTDVWRLRTPLERWSMRQAMQLLAFSALTADRLRDQLPGSDVAVFHTGIREERFAPRPPDLDLARTLGLSGLRVILTVGRLSAVERQKGHDRVIGAMSAILESVPDAVYLVVGDGDDRARLEKLAAQRGVSRNVVFTGKIPNDQLEGVYALCDVFVMPSKQEGLGIVYLEALACGKPVITGNCDGSVDATLGGRLGLAVDPDDTDALARAVTRVLNGDAEPRMLDPDVLRAGVIEEYGQKAFAGRVARLLERLASSGNTV